MAHVFNVHITIGEDVISDFDKVITKWTNIDDLSGIIARNTSQITDPLHTSTKYYLARFQLSSAIMGAVASSAPDFIDLGSAGASSATNHKIIKITHKATGFYYQIQLYPVTGSQTNAHYDITAKWSNYTPDAGYMTSGTYNPQSTTLRAYAISHTYTAGGLSRLFEGFAVGFVGGTASQYPQLHSAESALYGNQANPLPQTTTQGGGGFGTYNNSTDVTVNIGVKPSGFLSGVLGGSGFNFYYVPSYHDLIKAAYYSLNGVTNLSDFVNNTAALILNPSTYIVSACCIPVDKSAFGAGAMQNTIRLGGLLNFNVNCYPLGQLWADSPVWYQDLSQMYYDSFMDYEPYTKMNLFLPYIGMVPLNASQCMGGGVTVQYRFEGITGKCIAFVKTTDKNGRNTGFYQYAGDAGYSLPWVGNNGGGSQMIHSAASAAIGLAVGKADVPTVSSLLQTAERFYSQESRPQMQGGFGVNTGALGGDDIVLFIQRAQNAMPDKYYDVHGYQTATGGKIGDYSGFTRFDFVEISTDATPEENAEIETALKEGVFL